MTKAILSRTNQPNQPINTIHLGLGAFYRAFCCNYFQKINELKKNSIRVLGVSLKTPHLVNKLKKQQGVFTALEKGKTKTLLKKIECIQELLFAQENPKYLLKSLANEEVNLVTITVTEKGYCLIPSSGKLNFNNLDIKNDLENPENPKSVIGYLVYSLNLRKNKNLTPFTCLSCDNIPENGKVLLSAVLEFAKEIDSNLFNWIKEYGNFPSTMVDRIVPAITNNDIIDINKSMVLQDNAPIIHEPYSLWVIDNKIDFNIKHIFKNSEVLFVDNVKQYEEMKLKCLNGTHSALAYLGYLSGYNTIFESICDKVLLKFIKLLWINEILPTVDAPKNFILTNYTKELLDRYNNQNIEHLNRQIAMDGSQKLPQRILRTIEENIDNNSGFELLCEVISAWIRYTGGKDENGEIIKVIDPYANIFSEIHENSQSTLDLINGYLKIENIFSKKLRTNKRFVNTLNNSLSRQINKGTLVSLREILN